MGQFKPMVKMMTDEPSVILKLKKGGKVASKANGGFMPMASTQPAGLPARGGVAPAARPMAPSLAERRRAMNPNLLMKKGGKAEKHEDAAQDRAMIKKALAGKKFASGGEIDSAETKTTVKGGTEKFAKTKVVDGDKADKAKGTKGVKTGNAGGFATGGTISGNVGKFAKTKVVDGDKADKAKGTKGVKDGNAGGYATGGTIKGRTDWENRPADTAKPDHDAGPTGGVRNGNAGGFKKGGAAKKAYATGGNVVDDGKAVKMPARIKHAPVANTMQSGTFKKGGKVARKAEGGAAALERAYRESEGPSKEDLDMAKSIRSIPRKLFQGAKNLMGMGESEKAPGSVTETQKSVTVTPKKRGGKC